jgi:putative holliday junction resolvase
VIAAPQADEHRADRAGRPDRAAGRALGVDLGERRVGLARSDRERRVATAWRVLEREGDAGRDLAALVRAVAESEATVVVVGLPLALDGRRGPAARRAEAEVAALRAALRAPLRSGRRDVVEDGVSRRGPTAQTQTVSVETLDERFTTVSAEAALTAAGRPRSRRRQEIDPAAATVLLQAWLDGPGRRSSPSSPASSS